MCICRPLRRSSQGHTGWHPILWAKTLVSVPFEAVIATLFTVIIYFMIGFQAAASKFSIFMATAILVNLTSEMIGFIMGVITGVSQPESAATSCTPHQQLM